MRVALVHDWLITEGGAEKCLEAMHRLFPQAPLYTLFYNPELVEKMGFASGQVQASFLQGKRGIKENYRRYLPLYPLAVESLDLCEYDLILSSSFCAAKGVLTRADQLHICYCHSPARYAWDMTHSYLRDHNLEKGVKAKLARLGLHYLRMWDAHSSSRVDDFIANSNYTAGRIWRAYRRKAEVVYPPVDLQMFGGNKGKSSYFIFVSRLVPYKKAPVVIEAFKKLGLPLKVVGDGPQMNTCRRLAGKNIELLGWKEGRELAALLGSARALVFAAEEDFGIVPVEAQAAGTPVIAYGRGGVTETVIPADGHNWETATGVFYQEQSAAALEAAVRRYLDWEGLFRREALHNNTLRFNKNIFTEKIDAYIKTRYNALANLSAGV
ncbi:glycosyltransferase [Syntrophomonas palmitatica]|uniref:glycosyltransferase n=1 Tax=Syntrophomonas palmitatica TaxID=402877 RepID=UPI0006D1879C|nr:glycosyltransferase [Syntrophomonas palmitatica]